MPSPTISTNPQSLQSSDIKSRDLWLRDGNIIIRTTSQTLPFSGTQATTTPHPGARHLFRVHQSILSIHSSIFSGIFGLNQRGFESATETFDGIPVMDAPQSIAHFLRAVYSPSPTYQYLKDLPEPTLKETLTKVWPTSVQDWDRRLAAMDEHGSRPDPAQAIRLAVDTATYEALPAAFYDLALASWRTDRSLDIECLKFEELRCLLYGQKKLMSKFTPGGESYLSSLLIQLSPLPCPNDLECLDGLIQWSHSLADSFPGFGNRGFDPLSWIVQMRDSLGNDGPDFTACDACMTRMSDVFSTERARIWNTLGNCFMLDNLKKSGQ